MREIGANRDCVPFFMNRPHIRGSQIANSIMAERLTFDHLIPKGPKPWERFGRDDLADEQQQSSSSSNYELTISVDKTLVDGAFLIALVVIGAAATILVARKLLRGQPVKPIKPVKKAAKAFWMSFPEEPLWKNPKIVYYIIVASGIVAINSYFSG